MKKLEKKLKSLKINKGISVAVFIISALTVIFYFGFGIFLEIMGFSAVCADTSLSNDFLLMISSIIVIFFLYGVVIAIFNLLLMIFGIVSKKLNSAVYDSIDRRSSGLIVASDIIRAVQVLSNILFLFVTIIFCIAGLFLGYDWKNLSLALIIEGVPTGLILLVISVLQIVAIIVSLKVVKKDK